MSPRKNKPPTSSLLDVPIGELEAIVARTQAVLSSDEHAKLKALLETFAFVTEELKRKQASVGRLRQMLFGAQTEKSDKVLGKEGLSDTSDTAEADADIEAAPGERQEGEPAARVKRKGHGRNGAAAYTGAEKVKVPHPSLQSAQVCPACQKGKLYPLAPAVLVRITGTAPLTAVIYERERLRCNLCGQIDTAPAPEGVGDQRYDETATSMVGLLKYGTGLPFNRIEKLQAGMGIPLPAATQWDLVEADAQTAAPVHEELIRQAAQGSVVHNDDTTMQILGLTPEQRAAALGDEADQKRTGVFTSGIVSIGEGKKIALFFTGARHAGENLNEVLKRRASELPAPIQMCDALSRNKPGDFATLMAHCNAHGRRQFVQVIENFPVQVRFVLERFAEVYEIDALAREHNLAAEERLQLHRDRSAPVMETLKQWMTAQFEQRLIEPNSSLGEAIEYLQEHWQALSLFLRVPGAPLDNNICERALKRVILHRKNALFYKTIQGARVGDVFMSLIHTAELNGVDPFDYLVALQRHAEDIARNPAEWMPWTYQATRARGLKGPDPLP